MRVRLTVPDKAFEHAFAKKEKIIARAAKGAIIEMGASIKREGRANIIAGGLGSKVANSFRVDTFPQRGASINAAAFVYPKVGFLDVFERGDTIHGKPLLWLPLDSTPKRIGRKRITPELYDEQIGPLYPIVRPGKPPLLAGSIAINRRGQKGGGKGKVTLSALRRAAGGRPSRLVPLFVGIPAVKEKRRLELRSITKANAAMLPALFFKHLTDE